MESRIKGGGGALAKQDLTVKLDPSVNIEKTKSAQSDGRFLRMFNWATSNGIIMPSVSG